MGSLVYFASARTSYGYNLNDKLEKIFKTSGFADIVDERALVALKIHWGEEGNLAFVPPPLVRSLVGCIAAAGGKPFLTDTNTLYRGSRSNAVDNLVTAYRNGFGFGTVGAPVIVSDGLHGDDYVRVKIGGKHFKQVKIASGVHHANALFAFSHFKGHEATGFGGTLKNLGMGCSSPSGKQNQHSDVKPKVKKKVCVGCGTCVKKCPVDAITLAPDNKAQIDRDKCIGCAECTVVCPTGAIGINWKTDLKLLQEKIAEYSLGVIKPKAGKCAFFNLITNVTPDCDCCNWSDVPLVPDIGIAASRDPVALDQASVDLVNRAPGIHSSRLGERAEEEDKFRAVTDVDWSPQLQHGQDIGLGTREYELVNVDG